MRANNTTFPRGNTRAEVCRAPVHMTKGRELSGVHMTYRFPWAVEQNFTDNSQAKCVSILVQADKSIQHSPVHTAMEKQTSCASRRLFDVATFDTCHHIQLQIKIICSYTALTSSFNFRHILSHRLLLTFTQVLSLRLPFLCCFANNFPRRVVACHL